MTRYAYDIEVYPNVFTFTIQHVDSELSATLQIGHLKNDRDELVTLLKKLNTLGGQLVGFNNLGYDYPVLHHIVSRTKSSWSIEKLNASIYGKSQAIFESGSMNRGFEHIIWHNNQLVEQIDLFKIHHFDNKAKMTSLKALEIAMRSQNVCDLPFKPGTVLDEDQTRELVEYNKHDVRETVKFYHESLDEIAFRETLVEQFGPSIINHNDTKIGQTYFVTRLEDAGVFCYDFDDGKREPRQTKRGALPVEDLLFDYISFERPEFQAVHTWLRGYTINGTKEVLSRLPVEDMGELAEYADMKLVTGKVKELNTVVDGFKFVFGTGGLHGCVDPQIIASDDEFVILDLDVVSYYPSIAIENGLYPEHLSHKYCEIYTDVKEQRKQHAKGTAENAMLKLALNGIYGKSNDKFSPFYDPKYTMEVTINGQLLLCMLSEAVLNVPGVSMIQANTDGVTILVPREKLDDVESIAFAWEFQTGLELESVEYSRMFIRDVNNYIAEKYDGSLKRKGVYEYEIEWHQNPSSLVVKKAAEAYLTQGVNIRQFITDHVDEFDFLRRVKVPRSSRLEYRDGDEADVIQNITRYYVSKTGGTLIKIMPPLKGKTDEREFNVEKGVLCTIANDFEGLDRANLDVDFYVQETYKLIEPLLEKDT